MGIIKCKQCGTENQETNKFCSGCGSRLVPDDLKEEIPESVDENEESIPQEAVDKPNKKKKKKKILLIVGIIIALLVVFAAIPTKPEITKIKASYSGETEAGVVLDENNDGIEVVGITDKGKEVPVSGWTVVNAQTLKAGEKSKVNIKYENFVSSLEVECTTESPITGISAEYQGTTVAGTVIDNSSSITITVNHENGIDTFEKTGWTIEAPVTLEADQESTFTVNYEGFSADVSIKCSTRTMTEISATYDGNTEEGTVLDKSNTGIHVTGTYKDGESETVNDFEIEESQTLEAGETSTVTITYNELSCDLDVECSTMSDDQFRDACESIDYEDLARNPDEYTGELVKFTGEVIQVMESGSTGVMRVNVTKGSYGIYTDTVYVLYEVDSSNHVLEDDIVSFYGTSTGLYSYESIMGATITIPSVVAEIVDIE